MYGLNITLKPFYFYQSCFPITSFKTGLLLTVDEFIRTLVDGLSQEAAVKQAKTAYQALISTSTPEGKSNLLSASTVFEEDV